MKQTIVKPSWENAPEWAQWLAQDQDGYWCFYKEEPCVSEYSMWSNKEILFNDSNFLLSGNRGKSNPNWRSTLEKRPK